MAQHRNHIVCIGLVIATQAGVTTAQTLIDPAPAPRSMEIIQFGVPKDAKFIFCNGSDCPERSRKTLTDTQPIPTPPVSRPVMPMHVMPVPIPAEFSRAKTEPAPKALRPAAKKGPVAKKRPVQYRCGPDLTR